MPNDRDRDRDHDADDAPVFVSPERFAELTGLSPVTVRHMLRARRIKATKTAPGRGGSWLVLASEVDRLKAEAEAWRVVEPDAADESTVDFDSNDA